MQALPDHRKVAGEQAVTLSAMLTLLPSYTDLVMEGKFNPTNKQHKLAYLVHYRKALCEIADCHDSTLEKLVNAFLPAGKEGPVHIGQSVTVERFGDPIDLGKLFAYVESPMGAMAPDVISAAIMLDIRIEAPYEFTSSTGMVIFKRVQGAGT